MSKDIVKNGENGLSSNQLYFLVETLKLQGPIPPQTVLLGKCKDMLNSPMQLDLKDGRVGSILTIGGELSKTVDLFRHILVSASVFNNSSEVTFNVISPKPGIFDDLQIFENCGNILSNCDLGTNTLVTELEDLLNKRKGKEITGAKSILVIHDLSALIENHDFKKREELKLLCSEGTKFGIWPIVSVEGGQIPTRLQDDFGFGTIIYGFGSRGVQPELFPGEFEVGILGEKVRFLTFESSGE